MDQVAAAIPVFTLLTSAQVLFYCHFPDLLLAKRASVLHRLYRLPLDWAEEAATGLADRVVVNSAFTRGVFAKTFRRLHARGDPPAVLHPAVAVPPGGTLKEAEGAWREGLPPGTAAFIAQGPTFLSINRFERKKVGY